MTTPTIRVFISGRYQRKEEFAGYAKRLTDAGFDVSSSWLTTPEDTPEAECAEIDKLDVASSDIVVFFSEPRGTTELNTGGRHVEWGYAMGLCEALESLGVVSYHIHRILIGPAENLYHHGACDKFPDFDAFFNHLVDAVAKAKEIALDKAIELNASSHLTKGTVH